MSEVAARLMNRVSFAVILALFASGFFHLGTARATNGAVQAERWTSVSQSSVGGFTHFQFRRELFSMGTDGSITPVANYGIYDFKWAPGQDDDDSYAIAKRQLVDGAYIIVEYALDTDPDKAGFVKWSGPIAIDSASDPYNWVVVHAAPSSATTALDAAWNLLQSAYAAGGDFTQLSQALVAWRAANFAGLSYNDQLQFAQRAFAHGLLGTNLREIEATLRAAGFPVDLTRLLPANGVDLALTSTPTYAINGSTVLLDAVSLQNNRATQTGTVRLDLYAFTSPFLGNNSASNGTLIASTTLANRLDAGASVTSASFSTPLLGNLPNSTYYVALMVSDGAGRTDHYAFRQPLQVGGLPGLSPAEKDMPTQLINLSTRMRVETGDGVAIGGFIVSGSGPKKVIIRALGPSLGALGVPGTLSATKLELYNGSGQLITTNTGWTTSGNKQAIINSGYQPSFPSESAIVKSLNPGGYTAIVSGVGGEMGVALVEVYDLDRANANVRPINVSTRGRVLTGDNVMIGGFIIGGTRSRNVIVRAIGPSLPVAGPLSDPQLTLYDSAGHVLYTNDDWQNSDQAAAITASGMQPTNPRESAIVVTLAPGGYTAIVRGAGGATGVALVEVYDLE